MFQRNVPKHFLADAISIACFLINRMPTSIFNWATPYHQLFQNNLLFPTDPKVFGCTCFVRNVHPQASKLDPKSLKYIFVGYPRVQNGYRCYCPTPRRYFVSTDITFFETTTCSLSLTIPSQGENDDLLVYIVSSSAPPNPTLALVPFKPPIIQVYSKCQNPPISSPTPVASLSDLVQHDDLLIALCKGKRHCAHLISSFVSYNHLSSSSCSFIASLNSIFLPNTVHEALSHSG